MSIWVPRASKMDAAGDKADIAKTIEHHQFSGVLEGWRMILGAWRSSRLSCWHTGWHLADWLKGWLVVAGAGREALATDTPSAEESRSREGIALVWGAQNHHIYQETHEHPNTRPGTPDTRD